MRVRVVTFALALLTGAASAQEISRAGTIVNLNQRGMLAQLRTANAEQFTKVVAILGAVDSYPQADFGRWVRTRFNASDGSVSPLLLTTHPPQRDFRFTLDGTTYMGRMNLGLRYAIYGLVEGSQKSRPVLRRQYQ